jgi:transcriptional regulator with PAS, ATPase and Fis domain
MVTVWDHQRDHVQLVNRIVAECQAECLWVKDLSELDRVQYSFRCCVALVALGACQAAGDTLGLEVIRRLKNLGFKVIAYEKGSRFWTIGVRCRALLAGALCLLDSEEMEFADRLQRTLNGVFQEKTQARNEKQKIKALMKRLGIVGESEAMLAVFRSVLKVSTLSDLPVLITGETGTGKERIAHAIHQLDPKRCQGPFVALNCGAISPGLAESELFGHKKGAYTSADRDRKGLIRSAHGGVLFLDEIGELSVALQVKLLRVLQDDRVLAVGDDQEVSVDFRVIAATNRDLEHMVDQNEFRADLFHRLNVLPIYICPLRERTADLGPLIEHFLATYRSLIPSGTLSVNQDFIDALALLELPGNVRQLENLVRRAIINKTDDTPLDLSDLPVDVWEHLSGQEKAPDFQPMEYPPDKDEASANPQTPPLEFCTLVLHLLESEGWNLAHILKYCERLVLEAALHHEHGNQSQTAHLLGITPRSVYNKLLKHQML